MLAYNGQLSFPAHQYNTGITYILGSFYSKLLRYRNEEDMLDYVLAQIKVRFRLHMQKRHIMTTLY